MYSPKIDEDLIPILYKMAKAQSRPMTRIVNDIVRKAIAKDSLCKNKKVNFGNGQNKEKSRRK